MFVFWLLSDGLQCAEVSERNKQMYYIYHLNANAVPLFFNLENDKTIAWSSSFLELIYKFHKTHKKYSSSKSGLLGIRTLIWQWVELVESALIKSDQLVLLTKADKDWAYR